MHLESLPTPLYLIPPRPRPSLPSLHFLFLPSPCLTSSARGSFEGFGRSCLVPRGECEPGIFSSSETRRAASLARSTAISPLAYQVGEIQRPQNGRTHQVIAKPRFHTIIEESGFNVPISCQTRRVVAKSSLGS